MLKCWQKYIFIFLLFVSVPACSDNDLQRITSYAQLLESLERGHNVRAIMHFDKCTADVKNSQPANGAIGSLNFSQFLKYQINASDGNVREGIAASTNMLVNHPKHGYIYNYVRLRLFPDHSAEVFADMIDPKLYVSLGQQRIYYCKLSDGSDDNGLSLFLAT